MEIMESKTGAPRSEEELWSELDDFLTKIKPMPLDRKLIAEHLDEWMTYWDQHIRNSGRRR